MKRIVIDYLAEELKKAEPVIDYLAEELRREEKKQRSGRVIRAVAGRNNQKRRWCSVVGIRWHYPKETNLYRSVELLAYNPPHSLPYNKSLRISALRLFCLHLTTDALYGTGGFAFRFIHRNNSAEFFHQPPYFRIGIRLNQLEVLKIVRCLPQGIAEALEKSCIVAHGWIPEPAIKMPEFRPLFHTVVSVCPALVTYCPC